MGKKFKRMAKLSAFDRYTDKMKQEMEGMLDRMDYQGELDKAMATLEDLSIISAKAIELSSTVMVIFKMDSNELWLAEHNMRDIVKAIQPIGTNGYRLRMAAKMENQMTGLTITLSEGIVAVLDCSADVVVWQVFADEYNVASGLR
jgi:hypothetical protein